MKTAISIPDKVFVEADRLAKRMKKSRSQLYSEAIAAYVAQYDGSAITEAINRVLADPEAADPEGDAFVAAWGRRTIERTEW